MNIITKISVRAIRFYQRWISPFHFRACRFTPSCSEYTLQALSKYGSWKGWRLGVGRLLRCHPFHAGGYDPLP